MSQKDIVKYSASSYQHFFEKIDKYDEELERNKNYEIQGSLNSNRVHSISNIEAEVEEDNSNNE